MKHHRTLILQKPIGILFALTLLLAACSQSEEDNVQSNEIPKVVEVTININPEKAKINKEVEIQAMVTQGNEAVTDADDVKFEIWKEGEEKHEKIEATHKGDGIYAINKTFSENGIYHIIAHTNARGMHTMPKIQITVDS